MESTLGLLALMLMGLFLGLFGSGGSLLTLPILLYFFHLPFKEATSYSLAIVGIIALTAVFAQRKNVLLYQSIQFLLLSFCGMIATRAYIVPAIPAGSDGILSTIFAVILLIVGILMQFPRENTLPINPFLKRLLMPIAVIVGMMMGLFGVGGGFLTVPVLISMLGFRPHQAIATSLLIIALNALTGLIVRFDVEINRLIIFLLPALIGIILGSQISTRISPLNMRKKLGYLISFIGMIMLIKQRLT